MAKRKLSGKDVLHMIDQLSSSECASDEDEDSDIPDADLEDSAVESSDDDDGDSDTDVEDEDVDAWRKLSGTSCNFTRLNFSAVSPGCQISDDDMPDDEIGFFSLFFTEELLKEIVDNTNEYAKEKLATMQLRAYSIWTKWTDITLCELKAYFGVIMNMALHDRPCIFDYFSTEWVNSVPFFVDVFARYRFLQIHWMLHAAPLNGGGTGKGAKVQNVMDCVSGKSLEYFIPGPNIAIDESTIAFKGRVSCKMYNPNKPTKWGLRVYVLADSSTGYISAFQPYFGRETTESLARPGSPFTTRIVLHLIDKLLAKWSFSGFHLYTDRFYTGCSLALQLFQLGVHLTGTIQRNRQGLPTELKKAKKMATHEVVAFATNSMLALCWQDKRQVVALSTYHDATVETYQRKSRGGQVIDVVKPTVIIDYNKQMGGVDRADQLCTSYNFARKSVKWWRKLFFWLLETAIVNSYILFNKQRSRGEQLTHLKYRRQLIMQLVGDVRNRQRRRGRPSTRDKAERLNKKPHFLDQDGAKHKDCAVCSRRHKKGGRKTTVYYCKTCSRKPGLHPTKCFELYHSVVDYKPADDDNSE